MAFDGWFTYGGVEIINSARAIANLQREGLNAGGIEDCNTCPGIWQVLEDEPYEAVRNDPWADATATESADFLGFVGMQLTGFANSTITARVQDKVGDGAAVVGTYRQRREVTIRAVALAKTNLGLQYGLSWLASVFRGPAGVTCEGETLCFYADCPTCDGLTPDQCHEKYLRQLLQVAILDPPTVAQSSTLSCGAVFAEIEFTLVAGVPYFYTAPKLVSGTWTNTNGVGSYPLTCIEPGECTATFDCPPVNTLPIRPVLIDPCADIRPSTGGYYLHEFSTKILDTLVSDWFEKSIIIEYNSVGTVANFILHFIPSFVDVPCNTVNADDDFCNSCLTVHVPIIPDGSTVTIDSRTQSITAICETPGQVLSRNDLPIYGMGDNGFPDGVYLWPQLECGYTYCVFAEIYTNSNTPPDIKIYVAERRGTS